jgi:nucleoside-diphosphate-sugar epimerase
LAAGRGEKSYPDAFVNSVVTTRNLLDAAVESGSLKRIVNISSFSVYSNENLPAGALLDESCEVEKEPWLRGDAYTYAKVRQEELVIEYGNKYGIPYVSLRPGVVYGAGNKGIHGRIGISTFGIFLHLGGPNKIPLSYVDNCADAIAQAGIKAGIDGQIFNVVDDDPPSSREFLEIYKKNVRDFRSIYLPHQVSRLLCDLWGKYSQWSGGQLPPRFNRKMWSAYWKGNEYSNAKLRDRVGWRPRIGFQEAMGKYCEYQRKLGAAHA